VANFQKVRKIGEKKLGSCTSIVPRTCTRAQYRTLIPLVLSLRLLKRWKIFCHPSEYLRHRLISKFC